MKVVRERIRGPSAVEPSRAGCRSGRRRVVNCAIDHRPAQAIQNRRSIGIHDGTQQERAQIAIAIGGRGNRNGSVVEGLRVVVLLVREEEEGFVAAVVKVRNHHRSTERAAKIKLPLHRVILLAARGVVEGLSGVQILILEVVEGRPVQPVGAGFRGVVEDSAAGLTKFGGIVVDHHGF